MVDQMIIKKKTGIRFAIAAVLAVGAIGGVVVLGERGGVNADQPIRVSFPSDGAINVAGLPSVPIAPLDPGFTGGPPQQPNMGTKPPATVTKP
jgi:hypothetical protein